MPDLRIVTALPLSLRPAYEALLASAGLRDEGDADCTALLSSDGGALLACGSVSGRVLKQIAVAPWAEGDGACARIVTALLEESARRPTRFCIPSRKMPACSAAWASSRWRKRRTY